MFYSPSNDKFYGLLHFFRSRMVVYVDYFPRRYVHTYRRLTPLITFYDTLGYSLLIYFRKKQKHEKFYS